VELLLFHPGAAALKCSDCERYLVDPEKWEIKTYKAGPKREDRPQVRPRGVPTPCSECPKGSPEREHEFRLTTKNLRTIRLYLETRACGTESLTPAERQDATLRRNFVTLDELFRRAEEQKRVKALGAEIAHSVLMMMRR